MGNWLAKMATVTILAVAMASPSIATAGLLFGRRTQVYCQPPRAAVARAEVGVTRADLDRLRQSLWHLHMMRAMNAATVERGHLLGDFRELKGILEGRRNIGAAGLSGGIGPVFDPGVGGIGPVFDPGVGGCRCPQQTFSRAASQPRPVFRRAIYRRP